MNPQSNIIIVFFTFFTFFCQIAQFSEIRGKLISPYQIHMESESESDDHLSSYSELLNTTVRVKFEEIINETEILNLGQESQDENVQEISISTITSIDLDYYDSNDTTELEEIDYYGEQSYSILGVSEREEEFIVFDGQIMQNTTKIHLKNIEIDAQLLTQELKGLDRLHTLVLENIKFTNLSQINRVVLPKLRVFQLHHVYDSQLFEMINFSGKMKSFLFFDKSEQSWDTTKDLWSLHVDISVKFDVLKILEINHEKSELISALKYSNDILKSIKSAKVNLQKLSLRGVPIDSENLPLNLTYLNLHYVTCPLTKLGEVLGQSENLKELHLTVDKSLRTPIDITALPQSLQTLSLINFLRIEMNSEPQFNLTSLTTNECNFPKDYTYNYYQLKGLSNVAVLGPCFESTQELIGSIYDSGAKRIFLNEIHRRENSALDKFLYARGIGSNVLNFVLKQVQGTWLAKEVFPEQNHQEKRSLTGLSQFFDSKHVLHSAPKIDSYFVQDMEQKGQKIIQFNGSQFDLDHLAQMSEEEKKLVGAIHLTGVEIGAEFLPKILGSFGNLRHLFMNNVLVYGSYNESVRLPLLETFVYNEYYPMYRETVLKNRELPKEKLDSILFFAPDGLKSLRNFSIDLSVSVGGIKYLQVNHAKREIFSRLSYSSVIYKGNEEVKNIILHDTIIKISDLPKNLTSLSLYATDVDEDFSEFLAKNGGQLAQLYFYPKTLRKLELTKIPRGIKNLVLRNCDLVIGRIERKIELETLALYDCSFNFESEIHRIFEINEGFGIFNTFYLKPQSRPNHNMLFSLMKTEAKWIYVFSFDWTVFDDALDDDEQFQSNVINSRIEIASEVEEIFKNAGISKGSKDFLLKRQNVGNDEGLIKWMGKNIDFNERSSLSEWLGEEIL